MNATEFEQALLKERQNRRCTLRVSRASRWFNGMKLLETIHREIDEKLSLEKQANVATTFNKLEESFI